MTTPIQHPASNSDGRKRAADLATPDWGSDLREPLDLDAIRASRRTSMAGEVERLARWKAEALPVLVGLQELGRALGLPLGERITGQSAAEAAQALLARAEKAEAEVAALCEAVARVEALADEWERNYASMLIAGFSGASVGADTAAKRIRAALAQPATDEATAKQGFVVRADEPRCWRSECRNGCGYPGACSEKPATDEGWLTRESKRARERAASVPPHARPTTLQPATDEGAGA